MNVQFGFGYTLQPGTLMSAQPLSGSPLPAVFAPADASQAPAEAAPSGPTADGGHVMTTAETGPSYSFGYLSPAYLMVAPQMMTAQPGPASGGLSAAPTLSAAAAGPSGQGDAAVPSASGGHVVSNATNALAPAAAGYSQLGGAMAGPVGGYGMMPMFGAAQPVLLSPVFLQFGIPLMFAVVAMSAPPAGTVTAPSAPALSTPPTGSEEPAGSAEPVVMPPPEDGAASADEAIQSGFSVAKLNPADYQKFRLRHLEASLETSLTLSLRTAEGDEVSLDFSQLDTIQRTRFSGRELDGGRARHSSMSEISDRTVTMAVNGDLSDSEKAAIDVILTQVIDVADRFFAGALGAAMERLTSMDFDTGAVAEFSLKMSMQRSAMLSRSYEGPEHPLKRLAQRDGEIMKVLEFFADEQRTLIESASEVLDDESAVRLVRSLLPPLLGEPLRALMEQVGNAGNDAAATGAESQDEAGRPGVTAEAEDPAAETLPG